MSLEKLRDAAADLLDDLETRGEVDDLSSEDMRSMFESSAAIIHIFENNPDVGHLVLGKELDRTLLILKTIAVTVHKAKPLREKLEDVTGCMEWYECVDVISALHESLNEEMEDALLNEE